MKKILFLCLFYIISLNIYSNDLFDLPDDELVQLAKDGNAEAQYQLGLLLEQLKYSKDRLRLDYIDRDSFYWFGLAAESGHSKSQTRIAMEYLSNFGYFRKQDMEKAVSLLSKSSLHDSEAALLLSIIYYHGIGVDKNRETSMGYFIESQNNFFRLKPMLFLEKELVIMIRDLSNNNNPMALFVLGDFYYYGKTEYYKQDYKKAYRIYKQSAEQGNSSAQYMVGVMLYDGIGTLKDFQESYKWILKSSKLGNISAKTKAGIMNYFGEGTEINFIEALSFFNDASEQGDSLAQYFLGVMYYKGEGSDRNLELSKKWIKKAYENGSKSAKKFWETKELWR